MIERKTHLSFPAGMLSASHWDVSECSLQKIGFKIEFFQTFCIFTLSVKDTKTSLGTSEYTGGENAPKAFGIRLLPACRFLSSELFSVKPEAHQSFPKGMAVPSW
jgi:hypothetical protein